MKYTLTILEEHHDKLTSYLFATAHERAAFLLCRLSISEAETRLLVREVVPVAAEHIESSSTRHISINSAAYIPLLKAAEEQKHSIVFVHSHPSSAPDFSEQDDLEEPAFFHTLHNRIHHTTIHGSLVFSGQRSIRGRAWPTGDGHVPIDRIRIVGRRLRFIDRKRPVVPHIDVFERQARALGRDIQPLLQTIHAGIVGGGGTGSAVLEQLVRLGIGEVTNIDPETLDASNVSRVYGSGVHDQGLPKVQLGERSAQNIGLGTIVHSVQGHLSYRSVARRLRNCDVVFGCTDDQWGRSILTALAVHYAIPVFDMGVSIDTKDEAVRGILGRVTVLLPGAACLFCRHRISTEGVAAESIRALDPERATALADEGYIAGLDEPAPAVVPFTSAVASMAVAEFLHRLVGFMDPNRTATEVLQFFHENRIRANCVHPEPACFCGLRKNWMRGDQTRFLNLNWRPE